MYKDKKIENNCSMSIAGLDPSGGAGLLADCKTFHAHGIYATCVITAITVQNPFNVKQIQEVDTNLISEQIEEILDVYPIEFIKTGMLFSSSIIKTVSKVIKSHQLKAVVYSVMIAESGKNLSKNDYVVSLKKDLIPNSYIITPNVYEATQISDKSINSEEDMINVADLISKKTNVVITGGHMNGNDILKVNDDIYKIEGHLIDSDNTHGTGCTYSSAITSRLIQEYNLLESCKLSNEFIRNSIKDGYNKTPNQFWMLKNKK